MIKKFVFIYFVIILIMTTNSAFSAGKEETIAYVNQGKTCSVAIVSLKENRILKVLTTPYSGSKSCIIESAISSKQDRLYAVMTNEHGIDQYVHVFDLNSAKLIKSILISTPPLRFPISNLVLKPDGSHLYVSTNGSGGLDTVWDIDTATFNPRAITIPYRSSSPEDMAVSPDGKKLYVAVRAGKTSVNVIDTATDNIIGTMTDGDAAKIFLSHDGKTLYTSSSNQLIAFDTTTYEKRWEKKLPIEIGLSFVISPDDKFLYESPFNDSNHFTGVYAINLESLAVKKLSATKNTLWGFAINETGKLIYISDYDDGKLITMKTDTGEVTSRTNSLDQPETLSIF